MALTPVNAGLAAGIAGRYTETINPNAAPLLTGDTPEVVIVDETVLTSQTLAALTVVGFNGAGKLVPAVLGTTAAVGILVYAVDTTGGDKIASIYRGGCFNPDLLVWGASYDTDAKKRKAFEGAPSPTQIVIRKPQAATV